MSMRKKEAPTSLLALQLLLGMVLAGLFWVWISPNVECVSGGTRLGLILLNSFCWACFAFIVRLFIQVLYYDE